MRDAFYPADGVVLSTPVVFNVRFLFAYLGENHPVRRAKNARLPPLLCKEGSSVG